LTSCRFIALAAALSLLQGCMTLHVVRDDPGSRAESTGLDFTRAVVVSRRFSLEPAPGPGVLLLRDTRTLSGPEAKSVRYDAWDCEDQWSPLYLVAAPFLLVVTPFAIIEDSFQPPSKQYFLKRNDDDLAPPPAMLGLYFLAGLNPQSCLPVGRPPKSDAWREPTGRTAQSESPGAGEELSVTLTPDQNTSLARAVRCRTDSAGLAAVNWSVLWPELSGRPKSLALDGEVVGSSGSAFHLSLDLAH
jgi:hypothetical protein